MPVSLSGRSFLKLLDYTPEEIRYLINLSKQFKQLKLTNTPHRYLEGKNIVLLFEKTSTRTRCSFEVAGYVLGRFYDGIEYRGFAQSNVEDLAANAGVPVWNGLTTEFHPTQMIADMLTVEENFTDGLKGKKFVFMGDAQNNVANSLMVVCAKLGLNFVACGPKDQMPKAELVSECEKIAAETGGSVTLTGAHVIYTDIWVSMGEESDELWKKRIELLKPYQVNQELMDMAADDAIFMHCLPSFHDTKTTVGAQIAEKFNINEMEVTDEVFEGPRSRVFDEAENRMHTIKAVMYATLK